MNSWSVALLLAGLLGSQPFEPSTLNGLAVSPNEVFGGGTTTGIVTLGAPAPPGGSTVALTTTSGVLSFPGTVTVPEGASSSQFQIGVGHVSQTYVRSVTASRDGVNRTAFITLYPGLRSVGVNPSNITGGSPTTGGVLLWGNAPPGGATITLSDNSGSISTPAEVVVPAGAQSAAFSITTSQVGADHLRLVHGTLNGVTKSAYLTITAGPRLASFAISPNTLVGGQDTIGTLTLTGPVADHTIRNAQISDNSAAVITPPEVSISDFNSSQTFTIQTAPVGATATRLVTASLGGVTKSAFITLNPG